jgi:hypothetical protein
MTRRPARDIIASAVQRGAIDATRARYWQTRPDAEVAWLDHLAGGVVAGGGPVTPPPRVPQGSDPALYDPNPLLTEMQRSHPALVAAALAEDPRPPKLFGDADLPAFTASGLDPGQLAALPWPLRRPVAAAPTRAGAYELAAKYQGAPEMAHADLARSEANADYLSAFATWLAGHGGSPADRNPAVAARGGPGDYTTEALHAELFGPHSAWPTGET